MMKTSKQIDIWLNCVFCLSEKNNDNLDINQFKVGIQLSTNSLLVQCKKHNVDIKLFKLSDQEKENFPCECNLCEKELKNA